MGNPKYIKVANDINLINFTSTPYLRIKFYQQDSEKRYYRIKCMPDPTYSSDLPTFYLYLGSYTCDPKKNYTVSFGIQSVKNALLQNTSFEDLFTQFPNKILLYPITVLQSSASANFSSYNTSDERRFLNIRLKGNNFGPTWTCPTWYDLKYASMSGVAAITRSDQKGLQRVSNIKFIFSEATARYGTTIDYYSINIIGGFSHDLSSSHIHSVGYDSIDLKLHKQIVGNVTIVFSVTDSRGMITKFTRVITILPYNPLYLTSNDTHRQGGTGSTVILDFKGKWYGSPLTLTCTGIVAKKEGSSSTFASLTPALSVSGNSFSYNAVWSGVIFDPGKAYTITATFTDTIRNVTIKLPIPVGTPVLSIRDRKVGVNKASPTYALDVNGLIAQNGHPVSGYVKEIVDETSSSSVDLNNYTDPGFYIYSTVVNTVYNFPTTSNANRKCLVEVVGFGSAIVQKLFYLNNGESHIRTKTSGFNSWKKVTLT